MESRTILVTPAHAEAWLESNVANRPLNRNRVTKFARDMRNGAWAFIGDPIRFSEADANGVESVIDGQHRLAAVVESGVSVKFVVVTGLAREAQAVIDSGAPRSISDTLHMAEYFRAPQLAAAARLIWSIGLGADKMNSARETPTNTEIIGLIAANPAIAEALAAVEGVHTPSKLRYPVATTMWYFGVIQEPEMTAEFFNKLKTSLGFYEGDPALALRNRLISDKRLLPIQQLYLGLRALNLTRSGQLLFRSSLPRGTKITGQQIVAEVKNLTMARVNTIVIDETDDE